MFPMLNLNIQFSPPPYCLHPRNVGSPRSVACVAQKMPSVPLLLEPTWLVSSLRSPNVKSAANRWNKGQTDEQNPSGWGMFWSVFFCGRWCGTWILPLFFFCPLCSLNMIILMMANVFFLETLDVCCSLVIEWSPMLRGSNQANGCMTSLMVCPETNCVVFGSLRWPWSSCRTWGISIFLSFIWGLYPNR